MPVMGGREFIHKIAELGSSAKVVLMSSDAGSVTYAEVTPNVSILQKPVLRRDLYRILDKAKGKDRVHMAEQAQDVIGNPFDRQINILIAEDNRTNQLVLSKMLGNLDAKLRFAGNGLQVVDAFKEEAPDIILMDISMPELDGVGATLKIREIEVEMQKERTPIIALTAHAMAGDREKFLSHGMDDYLTKPIRKKAMFTAIERTLADMGPK
jgi:CheY-like chemotaxis protein